MKNNISDVRLINISELAIQLSLFNKKTNKPATSIIRFWEKKFRWIKPIKLKGNRRYYSKEQVEKFKFIKYLLKDKGLTIEGAKKILENKSNKLDEYSDNSIKVDYFKKKTINILKKIKKLKNG